MATDNEGFRYPVVEQFKCVNCRACERVCPVLTPPQKAEEVKAVAAKNRDDLVRSLSSSGGVFTALAEAVLNKGGVVCAAAYDECFAVIHRTCQDIDGLAALRGAKYSQSQAEHCFPVLSEFLKQGTQVLFVGTPCQVAALRNYLKTDYDNLLLVDMICHGVPSPLVWQKYLKYRQETDAPDSFLRRVNLRSKKTGWSRYAYCVEMEYADGTVYQVPQGQDPFMQGFTKNLYLRPSCANCLYKGVQRCSDLTIGDFWGIWDLAPEFDDNLGTSLLLIQSNKGLTAWQEILGQFDFKPFPFKEAVQQNPSAVGVSSAHPARQAFFDDICSDFTAAGILRHLEPPSKKLSLIQRVLNKIKTL